MAGMNGLMIWTNLYDRMKTPTKGNMKTKTSHTPGPWFVIPDYAWQGRHPCHDARYVATSQVVDITEWGEDADPPRTWRFEDQKDSIICTMPDSANQKADAMLISAAPDLLMACKAAVSRLAVLEQGSNLVSMLDAAIHKAEDGEGGR